MQSERKARAAPYRGLVIFLAESEKLDNSTVEYQGPKRISRIGEHNEHSKCIKHDI